MAQALTTEQFFRPDEETERRYKEQIVALAESGFTKHGVIDMGKLPVVYTELGIQDKELKTDSTTIRKALGLRRPNQHRVPLETLANLLSLVYNPDGVFKSLKASTNPKAYVAVLNAKSANQDQIIAILSPSENGKGFTFIPTVYDKQNFEQFLEKTHQEQKVLYIKEKGSELWGRLQSPPRQNSEPSFKTILTKDDVVKRIVQKNRGNAVSWETDNQNRGLAMANDGTKKNMEKEEVQSGELEQAKKAGYVQGVCECAAMVDDSVMARKLLTAMGISRETAKVYAHPDTYRELEKDIYAPKIERERSQGLSL